MASQPVFNVGIDDTFAQVDSMSTAPYKLAYMDQMKVMVRQPSGETKEVFDDGRQRLSCPLAWHPDGVTLYHSHEQIYAINTVTGEATPVTEFEGNDQYGVTWTLSCSPDGKELVFLHSPSIDIQLLRSGQPVQSLPNRLCGIKTDGTNFRSLVEEIDGQRIWKAQVNWRTETLEVMTHQRKSFQLWFADLEGRGFSCVASKPGGILSLAVSPNNQDVVYSVGTVVSRPSGGVVLLSLETGEERHLDDFGGMATWSPCGQKLAFLNDQYELWLFALPNGPAKKLVWVEGRRFSWQARGRSGYMMPPVWSSDGRYLWFTLSKASRLRKPSSTEFYEYLQQRLADAEESQRSSIERSLRFVYWNHLHKVGIIDFEDNKVWVGDGYWSDVAWSMPL